MVINQVPKMKFAIYIVKFAVDNDERDPSKDAGTNDYRTKIYNTKGFVDLLHDAFSHKTEYHGDYILNRIQSIEFGIKLSNGKIQYLPFGFYPNYQEPYYFNGSYNMREYDDIKIPLFDVINALRVDPRFYHPIIRKEIKDYIKPQSKDIKRVLYTLKSRRVDYKSVYHIPESFERLDLINEEDHWLQYDKDDYDEWVEKYKTGSRYTQID